MDDRAPHAAVGEASPVAPRGAGFAGAGRARTYGGYGEDVPVDRYVSAHSSELGLVIHEILLLICDRRSV